MAERFWFFHPELNSPVLGPYTREELRQAIATGQLPPGGMVQSVPDPASPTAAAPAWQPIADALPGVDAERPDFAQRSRHEPPPLQRADVPVAAAQPSTTALVRRTTAYGWLRSLIESAVVLTLLVQVIAFFVAVANASNREAPAVGLVGVVTLCASALVTLILRGLAVAFLDLVDNALQQRSAPTAPPRD